MERSDCETDYECADVCMYFLMYLYPVELHHRSMLSVPHHRGLNHLPESCFLLQQINKILF